MSTGQSGPKLTAQTAPETKARGANRSTKVAGKLKVLPDQPEPVLPVKVDAPAPPKTHMVTEESEDEEAESDEDGDDEEEPEDAEVCIELDVINVPDCSLMLTR